MRTAVCVLVAALIAASAAPAVAQDLVIGSDAPGLSIALTQKALR